MLFLESTCKILGIKLKIHIMLSWIEMIRNYFYLINLIHKKRQMWEVALVRNQATSGVPRNVNIHSHVYNSDFFQTCTICKVIIRSCFLEKYKSGYHPLAADGRVHVGGCSLRNKRQLTEIAITRTIKAGNIIGNSYIKFKSVGF